MCRVEMETQRDNSGLGARLPLRYQASTRIHSRGGFAEIRDFHGVVRDSGLRVSAWSYHMSSLGSSCSTASGIFCATVMMVA